MNSKKFNSKKVRGERIIYTASTFARQNLIYLQEIGQSEYLEPYESKRGILSSFLFCIVKKGSGRLIYHDITYELNSTNCILVNCDQDYTISSQDDLWELDWIHFNGISMKSIYDKFIERCGGPCFIATDALTLEKQHKVIFELAKSDSYVQDMELMSQLSILLTIVMEQCWNNAVSSKNNVDKSRWIDMQDFLIQHFQEEIHLDDLAIQYNLNKYYIVRKFKQLYGVTLNQYITNLRINHAKELLRFTDKTITQIAYESGYNDSAYFTRTFKKVEGISPTEFRKQWKTT